MADLHLLFEFASYPDLLAWEAYELLRGGQFTERLAIIAACNGAPVEILAAEGWTVDEARRAAHNPHQQPFALGERNGRKYSLLVQPKRDLVSGLSVVAIQKLLRAALALDGYRQQEKQKTALWPFELEAAAAEDGIYLSAEMTEIFTTARKIAPADVPVLITGETGTGKEVLARAIHRHSGRGAKPFVPLNCKAVPRDMLDSQLFGYRRGAFTGASEGFAGVIRAAAGGTLFLDEIGELDLDIQPKLLRFLETGEIHPLGEPQPQKVDVRIIAATNARIDALVADGRFREDLFYRLNVIRFQLPPLRERREEIPPLLQHFLQVYGATARKHNLRFDDEALEYLLLYSWPGNVRQLANEVRRIVTLSDSDAMLTAADLAPDIRASRRTIAVRNSEAAQTTLPGIFVRLDQPLGAAVEQVERAMISHALSLTDGQVGPAAEKLGVSRKGLFLKRRRLGFSSMPAA